MKRFLYFSVIALTAGYLFAGGLDKVVAKITRAQSLASGKVEEATSKITGYINRIDITMGFTTNPVESVVVASSNSLTGVMTTFITTSDVSATASYQFYTNGFRKCVVDEAFYLTATNTVGTNNSVQATIFYERL